MQINVGNLAVPIELQTANVSLTSDKKVIAKRKHFLLIAASAVTIHKSEGATYNEIVYEYCKTHSQQLVYVVLSRVMSVNNLYIVTKKDDPPFRFYHNRTQAESTASLIQELGRFSLNKLHTKAQSILNFMNSRKSVSVLTFNCQSLKYHVKDLEDTVIKKTNVLLLTETRMGNNEEILIPDFDYVVHFKRDNVLVSGVAIYKNSADRTNVITPNMDITMANTNDISVRQNDVGDICSCVCKMENNTDIVMVVVYISPGSKLEYIEFFIHRVLLEYSEQGSMLLRKNLHKLPLILAEDFNVNFADKKSDRLKKFLLDTFNLKINNNQIYLRREVEQLSMLFFHDT